MQFLAAVEHRLRHLTSVTSEDGYPEFRITGANVRIVNGLGSTDCRNEENEETPNCPNGLGNLIVGYNERRHELSRENVRTGSYAEEPGALGA